MSKAENARQALRDDRLQDKRGRAKQRNRVRLKRQIRKSARSAARKLRHIKAVPDGSDFYESRLRSRTLPYWVIDYGVSHFDDSILSTKLYANGAIQLKRINRPDEKLTSAQLHRILHALQALQ